MTTHDVVIRDSCRLCSGNLEKVLDLGSTPLANEYVQRPIEGGQDTFPLYLSQCQKCGHVMLPVVVDPRRLFSADYAYVSGTSETFRAHLHEFAQTVRQRSTKARVLEIGSNDGTLLGEFASLGHEVLGIEPTSLAKRAHDQGLFTVPTFWGESTSWDVLAYRGRYGLIVALNVFAHVDDLRGFVSGVDRALEENGQFIFEVGYLPSVIEHGLVDVIYHEHMSYHHLSPLVPFFDRFGMSVVDAHPVSSQGGSIRVFVERGSCKPMSRRAFELLKSEEGLSLEPLKERIDHNRQELDNIVKMARFQGDPIVGYGAPAKLTTLSHVFNIFPDVIYDDNPAKVGKYTPGSFIPIKSAAELPEKSTVLVFSWNFLDEIMLKHADKGCTWIVPLPKVEVY